VKIWKFPEKKHSVKKPEIQCPKCGSKKIIKKEKQEENNA
jgi:DNA-directed RNA polymerase subunit RPC12/RpoP